MIRLEEICDNEEQVKLIRYACTLFRAQKVWVIPKKIVDKKELNAIIVDKGGKPNV